MMNGRAVITWACLGVALAFAISYGSCQHSARKAQARADAKDKTDPSKCLSFEDEDDKRGKWVKIPKGSYRRATDNKCVVGTPPPAGRPASTQHPAIRIGKVRTTYRFDQTGCVSVFLRGDWSSYPQGGGIVFTSLTTGQEVLHDRPGRQVNSSLAAGDYRICKEDPSAWGVEIWQ